MVDVDKVEDFMAKMVSKGSTPICVFALLEEQFNRFAPKDVKETLGILFESFDEMLEEIDWEGLNLSPYFCSFSSGGWYVLEQAMKMRPD